MELKSIESVGDVWSLNQQNRGEMLSIVYLPLNGLASTSIYLHRLTFSTWHQKYKSACLLTRPSKLLIFKINSTDKFVWPLLNFCLNSGLISEWEAWNIYWIILKWLISMSVCRYWSNEVLIQTISFRQKKSISRKLSTHWRCFQRASETSYLPRLFHLGITTRQMEENSRCYQLGLEVVWQWVGTLLGQSTGIG